MVPSDSLYDTTPRLHDSTMLRGRFDDALRARARRASSHQERRRRSRSSVGTVASRGSRHGSRVGTRAADRAAAAAAVALVATRHVERPTPARATAASASAATTANAKTPRRTDREGSRFRKVSKIRSVRANDSRTASLRLRVRPAFFSIASAEARVSDDADRLEAIDSRRRLPSRANAANVSNRVARRSRKRAGKRENIERGGGFFFFGVFFGASFAHVADPADSASTVRGLNTPSSVGEALPREDSEKTSSVAIASAAHSRSHNPRSR